MSGSSAGSGSGSRGTARRVIVVGLDGLEPSLVEEYLASGDMPNLARMREMAGGWGRLGTTTPAQTPVAWSTFATGANPGVHGIFDFLTRDPGTYRPDLALAKYDRPSAFAPPVAINRRGGEAVWSRLSARGIPSTILRCPCAYPPEKGPRMRILSGMGVPDLRGGLGTSTYYTTERGVSAKESERVVTLERGRGAGKPLTGHFIGPRGATGDLKADFEIHLEEGGDGNGARLVVPSGQPREFALRAGEWSPWVRLKFKAGLFQSVKGMARVLLISTGPETRLLASPINFDPDAPLFPIGEPADFPGELARATGLYHTTGMVEDHAALSNGRLDEEGFLTQCATAWSEREAMMEHELKRFDEGLFFVLFDTTDRVQHMFWRYREPDHPANRGRGLDAHLGDTIRELYKRADAAVGRALEAADDRTAVIAASDHGFGSFRRGVGLNAWLMERGLLALKDDFAPGDAAGDYLRGVDWSRTKAYALGLAGIYLNIRGREGDGIVEAGEAGELGRRIAEELTGLRDPETGETAVRAVRTREELYKGPRVGEAADLGVLCAPGYRVSWGAAAGRVDAGVFEDNTHAWCGDHIVDPAAAPGVFFANRATRFEGAGLIDLAPTILAALGAPVSKDLEGRALPL